MLIARIGILFLLAGFVIPLGFGIGTDLPIPGYGPFPNLLPVAIFCWIGALCCGLVGRQYPTGKAVAVAAGFLLLLMPIVIFLIVSQMTWG